MLNLFKPIQLFHSQRERREPRRQWVCEWHAINSDPVANGVFLIEAGHYLDARQTAKKALRDDLARDRDFMFAVRTPSFVERVQLKLAPAPQSVENNFADEPSVESKNKT